MEREIVKEFSGKIIGYLDKQSNGDIVVKDFYGKILGYYRKNINKTIDFYGRTVANGNYASILFGRN